jgi:PHD/YefM family antitoxin component YafN of YafNO toxin-antitoxin module
LKKESAVLEVSQEIEAPQQQEPSATELIERARAEKEPIALTLNGQIDLIVRDAQSFELLLKLVDRLETLEGIREGLEDMKAGRTVSLEEARERLRRKHGIPR